MAKIISVVKSWGRYGVVYDTGMRRSYSADKLPKTVKAWIDANQIQTEPDREQEEQELVRCFVEETFPELFQPVEEWLRPEPAEDPEEEPAEDPEEEPAEDPEPEAEAVEIVLGSFGNPSDKTEHHDTPIPPRDPEAWHPTASQAVMLGMCLSLAAIIFVILELAELATIALCNVAWHLWSDRERILTRIRSAAAGSIRMAAAGAVTTAEATRMATAEAVKMVAVLAFLGRVVIG